MVSLMVKLRGSSLVDKMVCMTAVVTVHGRVVMREQQQAAVKVVMLAERLVNVLV